MAAKKKAKWNGNVPPIDKRFKPGQSGNPGGTRRAGAYVKDWWNRMAEYTRAQLQAVMDDESSPAAKVQAARAMLTACSTDQTTSGQPIAGADLDRIIEHTDGKATQSVELSGPDKKAIELKRRVNYDDIEAELRAIGAAVAGRTPADG